MTGALRRGGEEKKDVRGRLCEEEQGARDAATSQGLRATARHQEEAGTGGHSQTPGEAKSLGASGCV